LELLDLGSRRHVVVASLAHDHPQCGRDVREKGSDV
jgi:hypothetical protein